MCNRTAAIAAMLSMVAWFGCDQGTSEPAGGPGADVRNDQDQDPQQEAETFTASLDTESLEVPAGSQKEITISLERGEQFDQTVVAELTAPEGLSIEPQQIEYQSGQQEATATVSAESGAPVGQEMAIEIRFKPETGQEITKQLTVMVSEAEGQQAEEQQQEQ
jgi:hypothetical protein